MVFIMRVIHTRIIKHLIPKLYMAEGSVFIIFGIIFAVIVSIINERKGSK